MSNDPTDPQKYDVEVSAVLLIGRRDGKPNISVNNPKVSVLIENSYFIGPNAGLLTRLRTAWRVFRELRHPDASPAVFYASVAPPETPTP